MNQGQLVKMNPYQKCALILVAIGVEKASAILQKLSEKEVEKISIEMARLQNIPADILSEIVEEYYQMIIANKYIVEGGINYAKDVLEKTWGNKKAIEVIKRVEAATEISAFYLLQTVDDKQLLNFLQNEHPQTVAIILANLRPKQAAAILSGLPEDSQYEIAYRLATIDNISIEMITDIEDVLRDQMGNIFNKDIKKTGGVESVAEILNSVSGSAGKNILNTLRERDSELAEEIIGMMFLFDDIILLPDTAVQKILKDIDSKVLALALKAADSELIEKFYKNMSDRASAMLKEELEYLGPVRIKDVEDAQKQILDVVYKLEQAGEISLARTEDEQLVE